MEISSADCPKCGGSISEQINQGKIFKCIHCGSALVWPDRQSTLALNFGIKLCPVCGIDNEEIRNFCRNCGAALTKICPLCKTIFYVGDNFCPNGHDYEREQPKPRPMKKPCPNCGELLPRITNNCPICGHSMPNEFWSTE